MKEYMLFGLTKYTQYEENFRVTLYCKMAPELALPKHIAKQFEDKPIITFVINSQTRNLDYSFEENAISWATSFGGVPFHLVIPAHLVIGFTDDNQLVQIHDAQEQVVPRKSDKPATSVKPERKKIDLKLASYSLEPAISEPKGKLEIVK